MIKACNYCGKELDNQAKTFCNVSCSNKSRKPNKNSLANLRFGLNDSFKEFIDKKKQKSIERFILLNKICPVCGDKIPYEKRANEFCGSSCSARFNNENRTLSSDAKQRISIGVKLYHKSLNRPVPKCNKCDVKLSKRRKTKSGWCSKCWRASPESRNAIALRMQKRVKDGLHKGWSTRSNRKESFPEKFIRIALEKRDVKDFVQEYKVPKRDLGLNDSLSYFLDFYFPSKHLVLEVDGRQHLHDEVKRRDKVRDKALRNNGFTVFRLKWNAVNTEKGQITVFTQLDKFLTLYNSL